MRGTNGKLLRWALVLAVALTVDACAHGTPLPLQLQVRGLDELVTKMAGAQSSLTSYSAEVRTTYFGPEGRIRNSGSLAVMRPGSLHYEAVGPHGGVVSAFATNGLELQTLDVANSRFLYGRATPENLDRLLPFAPLGLGAAAWVRLLFGEIEFPSNAALSYDAESGHFVVRWQVNDTDRRVEIDPATARVMRISVYAAAALASDVHIEERDANGIPTRLHLQVASEKIDLEAALRDIEPNPELDGSAFALTPPQGIAPEHL